MRHVAIKMLLGDRAKYLGLVGGVTFATLLMAQQVSIFISLLARTAGSIYDVTEADLWVMDPRVRYIEEVEPLRDIELTNVRSVPGVEWAVPFYKGVSTIRLNDSQSQQVQLIGVDDQSLVGVCGEDYLGSRDIIRQPQTAIIDRSGYEFTWPNEPMTLPKEIELNDNRLQIRAVCRANPTFLTFPILYVTYDTAMQITPPIRNKMSFVLVRARNRNAVPELQASIMQQTGLQVLTQDEFAWRSIRYILERTGIPINFSITVILGIIIGAAITAQTFYIFVIENLKQFAAMKAIGVTNRQLVVLVATQATLVAIIGFGIGIGLTALFFNATADVPALRGFLLRWQVVVGVGVVIFTIVFASVLASIRTVFTLDPAVVFKG
jgi:putative ABC transport system permease protein